MVPELAPCSFVIYRKGKPLEEIKQIKCTLPSSDRVQLEIGHARVLYTTYCVDKDKDKLMSLVKGSAKWYGTEGARRILAYIKQMNSKELE